MKRTITLLFATLVCICASAQVKWHNAADLTVIGKPIPTSKPFSRIDTSVYKFNSRTIDTYADYSTGLAVVFETDSRTVKARWTTGGGNAGQNMTAILCKGLDLYIMKDGMWMFAGTGNPKMKNPPYDRHEATILSDMAEGSKQCLLYLPLFDRVDNLEIGLDQDARLSALSNPLRHKIVVLGSSITHGASASRPGMSYPARLGRDNGLYTCNLGFSGSCKLQMEYAHYLADIEEVDAFIFDTFSNPTAEEIRERFNAFVDVVRAAHPEVPMIFLQTERRETRNFSTSREAREAAKQAAAAEVVTARMKTDKNIYFIDSEGFLGGQHIGTVDGTHPNDLGFTHMLEVITPPVKKILKKYGIR